MWLESDIFEVTGDKGNGLGNVVELIYGLTGQQEIDQRVFRTGNSRPSCGFKVVDNELKVYLGTSSGWADKSDVCWLPVGVGVDVLKNIIVKWWESEVNQSEWKKSHREPDTDGSVDVGWRVTSSTLNGQVWSRGFVVRVCFDWRVYGK